MSQGKETPTAPPPDEATSPSTVVQVTTTPPVAGYAMQQTPLQGVPMVQNPPYPTAYSQNYQQQYHPTQPGQIVIYPTSQTTPLMNDANGVQLQQMQDSPQQQPQQQQAKQRERRRARSIESIDSDDCCDGFCCCLDVCNDCCCCCCNSIFDLLCSLLGKILGFCVSVFTFIIIAGLIFHFFIDPLLNQ